MYASLLDLPATLPQFHPSRSPQSTRLSSLSYAAGSHEPSILHLVVYTGQVQSSSSFHPHSLLSCPYLHSQHLHLYYYPANRFICIIFLDSYICITIWYLFFSFWLHSLWQALGSSTSLQLTQIHPFLWLSNIPLCICTISSLSINLSVDI